MNLLEATASVAPDVVRAQLQSLARLAWENEVNGQLAKAVTCHMDRIALSDKHAAGLGGYQADVWMDLALFHLQTGSFDKAANCLRDCIATDQQHIGAVQAYGALLCSYRNFDGADIVLKNGLLLLKDDGRAPPAIRARSHALLAIYYATSGMDGTGNLRLHELMQALSVQKSSAFATPTAVCIEIAAYLCELRLDDLARIALELGAALRKPKTVYTSVMWSTERFVQATIQLHHDDLDGARASLQEAVAKDATLADAWYLQGVVCSRQQQLRDAITCFEYAVAHVTQLRHEYHLPLFLQLGALYMHHQQWTDAKSIFLTSVGEASNASSWLGVGVVCVRQEDWEGAEMALAEANILDNTNADVWGYLSLVCLHGPVPRPLQAEQALQQALRYNLANPTLLREISNGFVALDKLEIAESLLRRSLRAQDSSLTRKTLADVLSAQNCAETALTEYQQALASCESMEGRADLLSRCVALLETLGRKEEAHEYKAMAARQQEGAVSEGALLQSPPRDENNPASGPDDV
ncbi:hypothetical protein SPRG_14536 [Saprolegnia parasitica CBS 223.65]|uniref:Uncharacterized protein n=1 Tax=Saprolegnia parasitica (strain CBS 223.65) TaxID=695850 RepID=A0A067BS66_SAPPC|nr:hypothetical protein SPRG_14536 [Saprolegnia parasitica CBS 223.65]KDO19635.1 hypothetical protein SPRG_14536 [Saprolegnia parasitica CBS 223.65]|eukprot:XP_012209636.1 hypothetical protein SPRG_14536 [Saprolegnia parasitica CBS 223.65]